MVDQLEDDMKTGMQRRIARLVTVTAFAALSVVGIGLDSEPACADSCAPVPELDCLIGSVHEEDKCDADDLICAKAFCQLHPEIPNCDIAQE
jgi:hypothetical protein